MKTWNFKVFVSDSGNKEFDLWLDAQPKKARAKIRKIITYLEITKRWGRPYAAKRKESEGVWEIVVVSDNIQYRPLGCFGPGEREFTLLIGAIEKNDRLIPVHAVETAENRRDLVMRDRRHIDEYCEASSKDN